MRDRLHDREYTRLLDQPAFLLCGQQALAIEPGKTRSKRRGRYPQAFVLSLRTGRPVRWLAQMHVPLSGIMGKSACVVRLSEEAMGRVEDHLTPQQLSYLSDRARARWCATQRFLPKEPSNHMTDERSWGAVDWFVRGADSNDIVLFGRRLPAPFGKPTYELHGRAILGNRDDATKVAWGDRRYWWWGFAALLSPAVVALLTQPLWPVLDGAGMGWTVILGMLVAMVSVMSVPYFKRRRATMNVTTCDFSLGDPLAEIIRLDAQNPNEADQLGAVIRQAVAHPDVGAHYRRMAELLVEIDTDLDRYAVEVVASVRNATASILEAPPRTPRDCERTNDSLGQIVGRLKQLERAQSGRASMGLNPGHQRADAAIADALEVIAREADGEL